MENIAQMTLDEIEVEIMELSRKLWNAQEMNERDRADELQSRITDLEHALDDFE